MELIKSAARRSKVSDIIYVVLNIIFALAVYVLAVSFSPPYLAYGLIVISKWRIFAVRPRFWFANLQSNLVDLLVGLSAVTLIWQAEGSHFVQVFFGVLYAMWLLLLKLRTDRNSMVYQAGISQFFGLTALLSLAYQVDVALVVLAGWIIGYVCARHTLIAYEEDDTTFLSLAWGLFVAEMSWLAYHWTVAYDISARLMIPQAAIMVALFGFMTIKVYHSYRQHGESKWKEVRGSVFFMLAVLFVLLAKEMSILFQVL